MKPVKLTRQENSWGWRTLQEALGMQPSCLKQDQECAVQDHVQIVHKYFHRCRLYNLCFPSGFLVGQDWCSELRFSFTHGDILGLALEEQLWPLTAFLSGASPNEPAFLLAHLAKEGQTVTIFTLQHARFSLLSIWLVFYNSFSVCFLKWEL